jgi:hypothetical protein
MDRRKGEDARRALDENLLMGTILSLDCGMHTHLLREMGEE